MSDGFDVCVVGGAGHVGLPLSLVFADKGFKTLIYDINDASMEKIASGSMPYIEEGGDELLAKVLKDGNLSFSSDVSKISGCKYLVITIGTPVDEFQNPVYSAMSQCFDALIPYLNGDETIVLRSTVSPGVTDWLEAYLRKKNLKNLLCYCPERVVQGLGIKEILNLPQLISGTSERAEKKAAELFSSIAPEVVLMRPIEAEFAKLLCNAYRYIEFAAANQFYMICSKAGVDFTKVRKAIAHNYPRMARIPGPGFSAGPCLYKDTMQLSAYANNQFSIGYDAVSINEGLPLFLIGELEKHYDLRETKVGLLGMSFKPESDDIRSSLSYKLKKSLEVKCLDVFCSDPLVDTDSTLISKEQTIAQADVLILCVPHGEYKDLAECGKPVVDVWNFLGKGALVADCLNPS